MVVLFVNTLGVARSAEVIVGARSTLVAVTNEGTHVATITTHKAVDFRETFHRLAVYQGSEQGTKGLGQVGEVTGDSHINHQLVGV